MRKLLKSEKEFVDKILKFRNERQIQELHSARLLKEHFNGIILEWTLAPKKTLKLYYFKEEEEGHLAFCKIVDYLYFIEELEANKYITLLPFNHKLGRTEKRYLNGIEKNGDKLKNDSLYNKDNLGANARFQICLKEEFYIDIVDMLEKYAKAVIYPLPLLQEFKNNEYKSLEEKYAEKQLNRVKVANAIAIIAVLITIILGLI